MGEFVRVGALDEFEEGLLYDRLIDGQHIAVVRSGERVYAMLNACTHAGYFLTPGRVKDGSIDCPGHGAVFQLEDGKPVAGPAGDALELYQVRVEGREVLVAAPQ
jgi:3-phenylpropionate/trans-cinnamate dioxygenase ferredoxin subunit